MTVEELVITKLVVVSHNLVQLVPMHFFHHLAMYDVTIFKVVFYHIEILLFTFNATSLEYSTLFEILVSNSNVEPTGKYPTELCS